MCLLSVQLQLLRRNNWKKRKFITFYFLCKNITSTNTTYTITEISSLNKAVHVPLHMRTEPNYKSPIQYGVALEYCLRYLILALTCGGRLEQTTVLFP
jgi:hypothetical protein